jgi:hypothetical protein
MKGCIYWYSLADPATDGALIASLYERGLQVQNPASGRVTLIGPEGDQEDTTPDGLVAAFLSGCTDDAGRSFQLWLTDSVDVLCGSRRSSWGCACLQFGFDGLDRHEASHVADVVWHERGLVESVYWVVDWLRADERPDDVLRLSR